MEFRLAMRVEGDWWVAYCAPPGTMENALEIGRIRMSIVVPDREAKNGFMDLLQSALGRAAVAVGGESPEWNDPEPAPEHERSGNA